MGKLTISLIGRCSVTSRLTLLEAATDVMSECVYVMRELNAIIRARNQPR